MKYNQWNPEQYEKFEKEREEPFYDLLKLIHPVQAPRILDLGCGNGKLTKAAHDRLHATYTLGIDTSPEMLKTAYPLQTSHLIFKETDLRDFTTTEPFSIILCNAVLQWIPNHQALLSQLTEFLAPGGQLAIQMPANQDSPTHRLASELAREEPFKQHLEERENFVLDMEEYALLIDQLGFESQSIRMQLYTHHLVSTAGLIEWVKGSLLTYYKSRLGPELYPQFLKEYQKRLVERVGWSEPFFFMMKRLFIWAQLPQYR